MSKSYLNRSKSDVVKRYNRKYSYIKTELNSKLSFDYTILPEEYSIFSDIDNDLFLNQNTLQEQLLSSCLTYLKEKLVDIFINRGIICVLPKLKVSNDDENNIIINWFYTNYRIYFSFDNEKTNYQSYCGIVLQEDNESFSSHSRKITKDNYKEVIDAVLQIVINNS